MATELELSIHDGATGTDRSILVPKPFAIIGPGSNSDVRLRNGNPNESHHIYLQVTDRGIVSIRLTAGGALKSTSPVSPVLLGRKGRIRVANYVVSAEQRDTSVAASPEVFGDGVVTRLSNGPGTDGLLNFRNGSFGAWKHPRFNLQEHLTIIGSGARCHVRLEHANIPEFHSCIVRLNGTFLSVALSDILELVVNNRKVQFAPLASGDEIKIGPFRVRFENNTPMDTNSTGRREVSRLPGDRPDSHLQNVASVLNSDSDSLNTLSLIQQMTAVNCMLLQQSQQQTLLLTQLVQQVQSPPNNDQSLMREQIAAIQAVAKEIRDLRRQKEAAPDTHLLIENSAAAAMQNHAAARLNHDPAMAPLQKPKCQEDIDAHAALSLRIQQVEGDDRQHAVLKMIRNVLGQNLDVPDE
jgi:hypothetical protein